MAKYSARSPTMRKSAHEVIRAQSERSTAFAQKNPA